MQVKSDNWSCLALEKRRGRTKVLLKKVGCDVRFVKGGSRLKNDLTKGRKK